MNTPAVLKESLVYFADCRKLPGRPSYKSLLRWSLTGTISKVTDECVKLEWCLIGRKRVTSKEAFDRFIDRLNGHQNGAPQASNRKPQASRHA